MNCPACGESVLAADRFCEACGASLLTARDVWSTLRASPPAPEPDLPPVPDPPRVQHAPRVPEPPPRAAPPPDADMPRLEPLQPLEPPPRPEQPPPEPPVPPELPPLIGPQVVDLPQPPHPGEPPPLQPLEPLEPADPGRAAGPRHAAGPPPAAAAAGGAAAAAAGPAPAPARPAPAQEEEPEPDERPVPAPPVGELRLQRDLEEMTDGPIAAVTGRGATHWRNEDAVGLRWVDGDPSGFAMVVCDGVSRSQEPQRVSQAAVDAALLVLSGAVTAGGDLTAAVVEATAAAQRAVSAVPYDPNHELGPGACTFVAVAVRGRRAAFASVGDSRAYWVDADGAVQIGQDDSLAAELVATGRLTVREAMESAGAHALTKWLGVDATDADPTVTTVELPGPGLVVLTTDGLWNYAPEPEDLARLIGPVGAETPRELARRLATYAEDAGGADNITVAVGPYELDRPGEG